jgi:hypothetical protein
MTQQNGYEWQCFSPDNLPDGVVAGWRMLLGLPRGAQTNLWYLLRPGLTEPEASDQRQLVETYAMRFEANPAHVLGAMRACQYVLREAAARKLEQAPLFSDLHALSGGNAAGVELLAPHYLSVRDELRLALLERTLADHGNVLVGFDWRVDHVNASNHGEFEDVPVVLLNLIYRHGEESKKFALQLTPSAIVSLQTFLERFETK